MMRPWRDEFREMTLELREWCDRIVVCRWSKHGVELFFFGLRQSDALPGTPPGPPTTIDGVPSEWFRRVADRRRETAGGFVGVNSSEVRAPPKLEPRRWCRRESHVTTETPFRLLNLFLLGETSAEAGSVDRLLDVDRVETLLL